MYSTSYSRPNFAKLEFSGRIFLKNSHIRFHENPSIGSGVVSCGQTHGRADAVKQIVDLRNFASAHENES